MSLLHSSVVDVLSTVTSEMMKEAQEEDLDIGKVVWYV